MHVSRKPCADPDAFPAFQLFVLAVVRLAEPIALTSIFPYAWALIKHFEIGDEGQASFYAGLLISSFSLAEALMGMYWGGLSDRIGRKPVLLLGCTGTMLSMLLVGLAPNIWVALVGRAIGGFLNGNVGVIQTMVGELVQKPEHEPRAYAIMPFVWSIGTIIGPSIGGTFSDPHASFPHAFPQGSLFARMPYLLPNVVCALLLLISILLGYFLLDETHPDLRPAPLQTTAGSTTRAAPHETPRLDSPLLESLESLETPDAVVDLCAEAYGTFARSGEPASMASSRSTSTTSLNSLAAEKKRLKPNLKPKKPRINIFSRRIMAVILALSIFTYHSMAYDATLPIFLEDDREVPFPDSPGDAHIPSFPAILFYSPGGLGLSLRAVGMIMAVNGTIALFVQAVVFPLAAAWIGVHRLFLLVTVLHPVVFFLVPCLLYVPSPRLLYPAIYACLAVRNLFGIIVYPLLLVLIKEATPSSSVLGRVNGLAASAGAACRMVAPPIAGYLYAVGSRMDCTALAWYSGGLVALVGSVQCFSVERAKRAERASPEDGVEANVIE